MARTFASGDKIRTAIGGCNVLGALTVAAIIKPNASRDANWRNIITPLNSGGTPQGWAFEINNANKLFFTNLTLSGFSTTSLVGADGWLFVCATKAAGSAQPHFNAYKYSTGAWLINDEVGATLFGDGTAPGASGFIEIGGDAGGSGDIWIGDEEIGAVWNANLTTAQIQNLPFTLQSWFAVNPVALWKLDQSATGQKVVDFTGGGANESSITGTTVSTNSVPVFNYTDGVWFPTFVTPAVGGALQIAMNAITSGEAWGTPTVRRSLNILAAPTAEVWGTPTLRRIVRQLAIVSGEAWGSPTVQRLVRSLAVATSEAWGAPTVRRLVRAVAGSSSEAVGTPFVRRIVGNVGISSSEVLGRPLIIGGIIGNTISILVGAIASAEAWGNPKVQRIARSQGITSAEQFGILAAQRIAKTLAVPSSEQMARPTLQRVMRAAAAASAEQVGVPKLSRFLIAVNIATGQTFGSPVVIGGTVVDFPSVVGAMLLSDRAAYEILLIDGETFAIGIADSAAFDILLGEDRGG